MERYRDSKGWRDTETVRDGEIQRQQGMERYRGSKGWRDTDTARDREIQIQ